jgi:hypothetical protein
MANLNLLNIAYLFFRLAPFIIVSFFVMDAVINNSLRGIVYLVGLLVACFLTTMLSYPVSTMLMKEVAEDKIPELESQSYNCNAMTLGENGPISKLPLSQTVFAYTLSYLLVLITDVDTDNTGIMLKNIPMIILFSSLILADFGWNMVNKCLGNPLFAVLAGGIGASIGVAWATILTTYQLTQFYYISGTSTKEVCSAPTQKSFKCWKSSSNSPARQKI